MGAKGSAHWIRGLRAAALLAAATSCRAPVHARPTARQPLAAAAPALENYVPYIAGEFARVYAPPGELAYQTARYLNDHTLVRGPEGTWHLYGITNKGAGSPFGEYWLLHATAPTLRGPWTAQPDVLTADKRYDEGCCLWAPHVAAVAPGLWVMLYYADGGGLRRAFSTDLTTFTRVETDAIESVRAPGGRDPFLVRDDGRWLLYSVGVDAATNTGQIVLSVLADDDPARSSQWTRPTVPVTTDPVPNYPWGNLESPTVVRYRGQYYLFATRTADDHTDYVRTVVLRSVDPTRFAWVPVTELRAHAAEVVVEDGEWWITSAGWPSFIGEDNRGLSIARLGWVADEPARPRAHGSEGRGED